MTRVSARAGADLWAGSYDADPNPLLALEMRHLGPRLADAGIRSLFDAGCGTGRWMVWAGEQGIAACGADLSGEMLNQATAKPGLRGRCVQASLTGIPISDNAFHLVICSFTLSYVPDLTTALAELSRIAPRVVVSDLHPAAEAAGWKRSFRGSGESYELDHVCHGADSMDRAATAAGLTKRWRMESHFDEPERSFFVEAGKAGSFERACNTPAVLATLWERA